MQSAQGKEEVFRMGFWKVLRLGVPYAPPPGERQFLELAEVRKDDTL
jgi:hypothetical protein